MKLFLIRHTEAIDYETESVRNDEYRYVTPKGRKIAQTVFRSLKEELADLDKIFTSPFIRCVQTSEILAVSMKYKHDVEIANELVMSSTAAKVVHLLKRNTVFSSIALVGHEPMMSALIEELSDRKPAGFMFKKAGVCFIDYNAAAKEGKFMWYFCPKTSAFIK
ncbi:MAG: phosphohistidine phosphatase SixA [Ignavibacteriae bacterium]|nr:phosphohistidine phosphatase SixA [Ignavibacteriota bacterium]